jgi:hypothetical protein
MSENNNEQMDLGNSSTASDSNATNAAELPTSPTSKISTNENTTSKLKLAIKTPKDKKDISIDESATVKQVSFKHKNILFSTIFLFSFS